MIHYQLRCGAEHGFDGWFRDSGAYEEQAARGLIECPVCGERQVARALMAPAVPRKGTRTETPAPPPKKAVAGEAMPAEVRAALQRLRGEVERNCDYVGDAFAAEARRIHDGDSPARGIYGEATESQAEALRDDGIEVGRIPWLPRADS